MISETIIEYILNFLTGLPNATEFIDYGMATEIHKPISIVKSEFFNRGIYGTNVTIPKLPLKKIDDELPILFGSNIVERRDDRTVIYGDIIASSFFLLSRYDEFFFDIVRDMHGRPVGRESFKSKAGIMDRPLVDEYGYFLCKELQRLNIQVNIRTGLNRIYLTHDVDHPWVDYTLVNGFKTSLRNAIIYRYFDVRPILNGMGIYKWNAVDSFGWIMKQDHKLKNEFGEKIQDIYFIMGVNRQTSMSMRYWDDKRSKKYLLLLRQNASVCGLHSSYEAGYNSNLIEEEKKNVESTLDMNINHNRNHYLISNSTDWLNELIRLGIDEDYTIGYADVLGFRMGTCRRVKWIDPINVELKNIFLQPLSIMDSTLMESQYLALDLDESRSIVKYYIDLSNRYGGDFCFLLHNDTLCDGRYKWMKRLYVWMLDYISQIIKQSERNLIN